jgi:nicotinate-nucleotide adenylyltransferase
MGGTFDPIHLGHLVAAEEARLRLPLERVIFIPNGSPPHKKDYDVTPAEARYDMVALATASNPFFEVSRIEIDRPGPSYSADTVQQLKETLDPTTKLYFITGADAILELLTWHRPRRLAELCELVAVMRPGYEIEPLEGVIGPDLADRVRVLRVPGVEVSSTELRRRAAAGESLRYLTPPSVVSYIEGHHLYSEPQDASPAAGQVGVSSGAGPGLEHSE